MKKLAFIIHGKYAAKQQLENEILQTFGEGYKPRLLYTMDNGHGIELSRQAVLQGNRYIICVGGDGSLNECVNGIMLSGVAEKEEVVLGLLPRGTGNDFLKTIKTPAALSGLKALIDTNSFKPIDLGFATYTNLQAKPESRYYINITDVGMGGVAVEKLTRTTKALGALFAYQYSIITSLIGYKKPQIDVQADSFTKSGKMMNLFVANGNWLGNGLCVSPEGSLNDGLLNIVAIGDVSILDYLKHLPGIRKGNKIIHPEVHYYTARELTISSPLGPLPIDMDGEFIGHSPLKVKVLPRALNFLA